MTEKPKQETSSANGVEKELNFRTPEIVFLTGEGLITFQSQRLLETLTKREIFDAFGYSPYVNYPKDLADPDQQQAEDFIRRRFEERQGLFIEEISWWKKIMEELNTEENWKVVQDICGNILPKTIPIGIVDFAVGGDCSRGKVSILTRDSSPTSKERDKERDKIMFIHEVFAHFPTIGLREETTMTEDIRDILQSVGGDVNKGLVCQNAKELLMNCLTAEFLVHFGLRDSFSEELLGERRPPMELSNKILQTFYKGDFMKKQDRQSVLRYPGNIETVIDQVDREVTRYLS